MGRGWPHGRVPGLHLGERGAFPGRRRPRQPPRHDVCLRSLRDDIWKREKTVELPHSRLYSVGVQNLVSFEIQIKNSFYSKESMQTVLSMFGVSGICPDSCISEFIGSLFLGCSPQPPPPRAAGAFLRISQRERASSCLLRQIQQPQRLKVLPLPPQDPHPSPGDAVPHPTQAAGLHAAVRSPRGCLKR